MKPGDAEYTALVEKKRSEIRGNISSVKLTPQECEAEVKAVTSGAISSFADTGPAMLNPTGEPAKEGIEHIQAHVIIKKRGRPPGSRNKPKPPKGS